MTFVLLTGGIDLSVGSNMYVSAMTVGYLLQLPALQGGFGVFAGHCRRARDRRGLRRDQRVLRGVPAHNAIPCDACHDGRRPRPRHRDHRVLRHRLPRAAFTAFGAASILGVPIPIAVFAIVVAAAHLVLTRTPFGRQLYAVGNDVEAARKAGIDTDRIVFSVYVICGVCAALGGVTLIALVGRLNQTFGVGKEFDVITAAVLGGTSLFGGVGGAFGAVVGSVLVQMVQAGMVFVKVNLYLQPMVLAGIIFIAVFFDSLREARPEAETPKYTR